MVSNDNTSNDSLSDVLADVDETYGNLPERMRLQIEKISKGMAEFGPRKLNRQGLGTEFFEAREYRPGIDERKAINARMSAKAQKEIVVEKEAEIRQHFYLWRKGYGSMDFASDPDLWTKKEAAEIMLLAFAKHLAKNEELIGVLDRKGTYRGGKVSNNIAAHLQDVNIIAGDMPSINRKLPMNSTVVLFSDFYTDPKEIVNSLDQLQGQGLRGFMVMTLDPQELEFNAYEGHTRFKGLEGEGTHVFKKAQSVRHEYQEKIGKHIEWLRDLAQHKGYEFMIQRTDKPLHHSLLRIYGVNPHAPAHKLTYD